MLVDPGVVHEEHRPRVHHAGGFCRAGFQHRLHGHHHEHGLHLQGESDSSELLHSYKQRRAAGHVLQLRRGHAITRRLSPESAAEQGAMRRDPVAAVLAAGGPGDGHRRHPRHARFKSCQRPDRRLPGERPEVGSAQGPVDDGERGHLYANTAPVGG